MPLGRGASIGVFVVLGLETDPLNAKTRRRLGPGGFARPEGRAVHQDQGRLPASKRARFILVKGVGVNVGGAMSTK